MRRQSSLITTASAVDRNIDNSAYDNVRVVAESIGNINTLGIVLRNYGVLTSAPINGGLNPLTNTPYTLGLGHMYFDIGENNNKVYVADTMNPGQFLWVPSTLSDEVAIIEAGIRADHTSVLYGAGVPVVTTNPVNGTNAVYVDTNTNTSYICKDATPNSNVWVVNGSGQFADIGTSIGKGIQYMAQVSGVEDVIVPVGTSAFSIDSLVIADGATLTIPNNSVYKVL
jgi:hypothetical protein